MSARPDALMLARDTLWILTALQPKRVAKQGHTSREKGSLVAWMLKKGIMSAEQNRQSRRLVIQELIRILVG